MLERYQRLFTPLLPGSSGRRLASSTSSPVCQVADVNKGAVLQSAQKEEEHRKLQLSAIQQEFMKTLMAGQETFPPHIRFTVMAHAHHNSCWAGI
jgi:hypothetical protein